MNATHSTRPALIAAALLAAHLATAAAAQRVVRRAPKGPVPSQQAMRLVAFLELPARRQEAANELLRLGKPAVPALIVGIQNPRSDIAFTCMHILRVLGPDATAALPTLRRLAEGDNKQLARAADWARSGVSPRGTTLVADYANGAVLEFGADGKQIFELRKLNSVWDVERVANGNLLITEYTKNRVRELTPKGEEVWSFAGLKTPLDADRLPGGNTLIADTHGNRVIEVDPNGKIVWRHECRSPYDADRLPNGNTLISEYSGTRVIEVCADGKVVAEIAVSHPFGADRLANGNTLICVYSKGEVHEVNPKGEVVSRLRGLTSPNEARRLANGHTLVAESAMVREFDQTGKEVRRIVTGRAGTVHRH